MFESVISQSRVQSFRRSMRRSFRSRSRSTSSISLSTSGSMDGASDRRKIAQTLNREAGMKERGGGARARGAGRQRVNSEPASGMNERSQSPLGSDQVPPEMMGVVTHLTFAETYVSGEWVWPVNCCHFYCVCVCVKEGLHLLVSLPQRWGRP